MMANRETDVTQSSDVAFTRDDNAFLGKSSLPMRRSVTSVRVPEVTSDRFADYPEQDAAHLDHAA